MTPETKEMREATQSKAVEETQSGPVVAIQYPEKWEYSENEKSAGELAKKYERFKALSPDDKEGYKELVLAIADMRTRRTDVAKQEKVIKDPLNKFRDVVIKTSKAVRGLLGKTEDDLKATKTRIDDILGERKLAMQRLWQENLNSISLSVSEISGFSKEKLSEFLAFLNNYDFKALDFGEYIEQAKAAVDNAINTVAERIEILEEKERLRLERLHQENLNIVHGLANQLDLKTDEALQDLGERLNNFDLSSMEFGDSLEEAREAVELALLRCRAEYKRRSEAKAERHRLKLEAETREREESERKANEAAEQKIRDDEKAEADRKQAETDAENQRLRDQIAAMEKEKEPEPEPEPLPEYNEKWDGEYEAPFPECLRTTGVDMASGPDSTVEAVVEIDNGEIVNITPVAGRAAAIEQEPESTVVREEPKQVEEINENLGDRNELKAWAKEIETAINNGPINQLYSGKATRAVNAVYDQLNQITEYLNKTAESLR